MCYFWSKPLSLGSANMEKLLETNSGKCGEFRKNAKCFSFSFIIVFIYLWHLVHCKIGEPTFFSSLNGAVFSQYSPAKVQLGDCCFFGTGYCPPSLHLIWRLIWWIHRVGHWYIPTPESILSCRNSSQYQRHVDVLRSILSKRGTHFE